VRRWIVILRAVLQGGNRLHDAIGRCRLRCHGFDEPQRHRRGPRSNLTSRTCAR
jgi:hypothetical protein